MKGKIEELGNNAFTCGMKSSGDYYGRVKENVSDYLGREYGKEIRVLMMNGGEATFVYPTSYRLIVYY